jgi:hypothetical protein
MSRTAFSALSFCLLIIVPLCGDDEPKVSLIQTPLSVQLLLTANSLVASIESTSPSGSLSRRHASKNTAELSRRPCPPFAPVVFSDQHHLADAHQMSIPFVVR